MSCGGIGSCTCASARPRPPPARPRPPPPRPAAPPPRRAIGGRTATTAPALLPATEVARARRRGWRHVAQIPHGALNHAGLGRSVDLANDFAVRATYGEFHLLRRLR